MEDSKKTLTIALDERMKEFLKKFLKRGLNEFLEDFPKKTLDDS